MKCIHPVLRLVKINGKREYVMTPCGICTPCRLNNSHQWGIRIMNEAKSYLSCVFITLTYDDEHLPQGGVSRPTLKKNDLQNFMKRLRYFIEPDKVRFFGCGEYGTKFKRPHYHVIVFGLSVHDKRVFKSKLYDAKSEGYYCKCTAWDKGLVHVGTVTLGSANYVASYTLKKIKGKGWKEKYDKLGIQPEFALMSNRPGIGYEYMQKNKDYLLRDGFMYIDGRKVGLPRYYATKLGWKDTETFMKQQQEQEQKFYEKCVEHWKSKDWQDNFLQDYRNNLDLIEQKISHFEYLDKMKGKDYED